MEDVHQAQLDCVALGYSFVWESQEDHRDEVSRVTVHRLAHHKGPELFPFEPYYGLRFAQLTWWLAWQRDEGKGRMFDEGALMKWRLAGKRAA
jgi:hypothetical protein